MFSPQTVKQRQLATPLSSTKILSRQTTVFSVLQNSSCRLLRVLNKRKPVPVHTTKTNGSEGRAPLIVNLGIRRSTKNHTPTAFISGEERTVGTTRLRCLEAVDKTRVLALSLDTTSTTLRWAVYGT